MRGSTKPLNEAPQFHGIGLHLVPLAGERARRYFIAKGPDRIHSKFLDSLRLQMGWQTRYCEHQ